MTFTDIIILIVVGIPVGYIVYLNFFAKEKKACSGCSAVNRLKGKELKRYYKNKNK